MDYILKFKADIEHKNNSISRKSGELDVSCCLTLDEMKSIINEEDVREGIILELQRNHKMNAINVEVYDILEKSN